MQPHARTYRRADITAPFRRWHGAPLRWSERSAIFTMERQRRRTGVVRAHIIDPPGHDSTAVLLSYISWLQHLNPDLDACIIAERRPVAKALGLRLFRPPTCTASHARVDRIRGCTFQICLVHGLHPAYARIINRVINPILINDYPGTVLIYHTPENRRIPDLPSKFEPQITLTEYRAFTALPAAPAAGDCYAVADLRIRHHPSVGSPNPGKSEIEGERQKRTNSPPSPAANEFIIYNLQFIIPSAAAAAPRPKAKPQQRVL
ncbi:MAG: hypothetical protein NC418_10845 [Muribaculaceae bacterium]|nr:hypothetical protein [Muribaculaceae bacterium]